MSGRHTTGVIRIVVGLILFHCTYPAQAQIPTAQFTVIGAVADLGSEAIASVTVTCSVPIDGFSLGISHPASELSVVEFAPGSAVDPVRGGVDPDYLAIEPVASGFSGVIIGCLIDFTLVVQLSPAMVHSVAEITYLLSASSGTGSSPLILTDTLGAPPITLEVISGLTLIMPALVHGSIQRLAAPGVDLFRGDCNDDGSMSIADPIFLLGYLFAGGDGPICPDSCDGNDDGMADISDAIASLGTLFAGGPPPAPPFPFCGNDSTPDALPCPFFSSCP